MSPETLQAMLVRQPFVPFRIFLSDQAHYDITKPALVWVGNRETQIGIVRNTANEFWDEPVFVVNANITRVEPIIQETVATS